jgi:hypothetical protein
MNSTLEVHKRPLSPAEKRLLQAKVRSHEARGRRVVTRVIPVGAAIILFLWLATLLVSDAPWPVVTGFWASAGAAIALWVLRDAGKDARQFLSMARDLESALRTNTANVYDVRARRFVGFEEIEDEGACYAFELEGGRLVFIIGQEFYPGPRFPSLDFSLVYPLDERGRPVDMMIDKRGSRAAPARVVPAATKRKLALPDHLETRAGRIADLEQLLQAENA